MSEIKGGQGTDLSTFPQSRVHENATLVSHRADEPGKHEALISFEPAE